MATVAPAEKSLKAPETLSFLEKSSRKQISENGSRIGLSNSAGTAGGWNGWND